MKNIYKYLVYLVLILAIGIMSCQETEESAEVVLSVVESNVTFQTTGSNDGYIRVNLTEGYTATSNKSWCTVSIDKNIVKVSANTNNDLDSRAALITLTYGDQIEEISVFQYGLMLIVDKPELVFDLDDDAPEYSQKVRVSCTFPVTLEEVTEPWVTATLDENNILTVYTNSASTTDRSTTIVLTSGMAEVKIAVTQRVPVYADYLGEWTLTGMDVATGNTVVYPNIKITQKVKGSSYKVEGWGINAKYAEERFEMMYNPATNGVSIIGQQRTGTYTYGTTKYKIFLTGIIIYNNGLIALTGEYIGLSGKLKHGSVTWNYPSFNIDGSSYRCVGMAYRLTTNESSWATLESYVLYNAVLTKK
jgi:hypothetical protein